ncbi:Minor tail protein M [Escherichia coli]|nr:Minor tail protein M [Escherichia coli]
MTSGKKAAADFMQQQARDGGPVKWSIPVMETFRWKVHPDMNVVSEPKVVAVEAGGWL